MSVVFDLNLVVSTSQSDFLSNSRNKAMLIKVLSQQLHSHGLTVLQAAIDADALIVMTARKLADNSRSVTVVASDTDILAMLAVRTQPEQNILIIKPGTLGKTDNIFPIQQVQEKISEMKNVVLFLHAITGCDATSSRYGKGKKTTWTILSKSEHTRFQVCVFNIETANPDEVATSSEEFIMQLYGGIGCDSLDKLRFLSLNRFIARQSLNASFGQATLPTNKSCCKAS